MAMTSISRSAFSRSGTVLTMKPGVTTLSVGTIDVTGITIDENYDRFFQIKNTCESLNFSPSDVTMIGDRIHDINSATKANCNSILVNRNDIKSKKLKELMNIL